MCIRDRPYCFEEAAGYTAAPLTGGPPASQGSATTSTPYNGSVEDNYTLNWVDLPPAGSYDVTLSNNSSGGALRATVACDATSGVAIAAFPAVVGAGQAQTVPGFNSASCSGTPVAVITNQSKTCLLYTSDA